MKKIVQYICRIITMFKLKKYKI